MTPPPAPSPTPPRPASARVRALVAAAPALVAVALGACRCGAPGGGARAGDDAGPRSPEAVAPHGPRDDAASDAEPPDGRGADAGRFAADAADAGGAPPRSSPEDDDPMALHRETGDALRALFDVRPMSDAERARTGAARFLDLTFGVGTPARVNQGNKALAGHTIARAACLRGLEGVVLQTPEQKALCGGAENMVPVHAPGKPPWFCIDVFEFPNRACELPMVWTSPSQAKAICELQGKRLCSQVEWTLACKGSPDDAPMQRYAYGDALDLAICNTNKPKRGACNVSTARTTYDSCATDTEPSGAFPRCRSRFGVYDQHGNVAEIMMRREGGDGPGSRVVSQLKGSAWFYKELAREPGGPPWPGTRQGAYPDHCDFDPRWHVEPLERAQHVNYHLGFRCCRGL